MSNLDAITKLNEFIDYNCETWEFHIKAHSIDIPETSFSIKGSRMKSDTISIMQKIVREWPFIIHSKKKGIYYGRDHRASNGNQEGRDFEDRIEKFIISRLPFGSKYKIFQVTPDSIDLKIKKTIQKN
jgi:hypothetical protein